MQGRMWVHGWLFLIVVGASAALPSDEAGRPPARDARVWMRANLPEVPAWTEWQRRSGESPPAFAQLPKTNRLPDPLRFNDGRVVTTAEEWEQRRGEIMGLMEEYVTGTFPPQPVLIHVELLAETTHDRYRVRDVRLDFESAGRRGALRVQLTMPDSEEPLPALITPGFGGWAPRLVRRGYVAVGFAGSDRADDGEGLVTLFPEYDFATLPRRAWLVPVVLDYLATVPEVRRDQIALFGYSRDGKMAAIASALEPRLAALIAGSTGVGGFLPWRLAGERGSGEGIESTTRMFPHWFHPRLRYFSGREDRLPVDANLLLALSAPRPVLIEYGLNDEVSNAWALEQARDSAARVYRLLGAEPPSLLRSPGFHGGIDAESCLDWLDGVFGRSSQEWINDRLHPWAPEAWQARTGETSVPELIRNLSAAARTAATPDPAALRQAVQWLLGEQPPHIPTTGRRAAPSPFPLRPPPPGPVEVAAGAPANPGQLAPDVPAWVISRGGQEFGWLEPQKHAVQSRRIRFGANVEGHLYWPADAAPDVARPTVIWLHGDSYPLGYMWVYRRDLHPILALVEAGFAVFAYDQTGYGSRALEAKTFYERYPNWSRLGRMVEDVGAAIDALAEEPLVDAQRISLFGYTLGGTVALYAAALDERVASVVSVCGFTPMRTDRAESGLTGLERYYRDRSLIPRLLHFAEDPAAVPFDFDDLLTLIAPRRVLVVQPLYDRDASAEGVRTMVESARTRGAGSELTLFEPDDYARLTTATQQHIINWLNPAR